MRYKLIEQTPQSRVDLLDIANSVLDFVMQMFYALETLLALDVLQHGPLSLSVACSNIQVYVQEITGFVIFL